jgi:hypothetical protein
LKGVNPAQTSHVPRVVRQRQVTSAQDHLRSGVRLQMGFNDDDDVQRLANLLMKPWGLIPTGLDEACELGLLQVLVGHTAIAELVPICSLWPTSLVRAGVRQGQHRIAAPVGNTVQPALSHHV